MKVLHISFILWLTINPLFSQVIKFDNEYAIWSNNPPGNVKGTYPSEDYTEKKGFCWNSWAIWN